MNSFNVPDIYRERLLAEGLKPPKFRLGEKVSTSVGLRRINYIITGCIWNTSQDSWDYTLGCGDRLVSEWELDFSDAVNSDTGLRSKGDGSDE